MSATRTRLLNDELESLLALALVHRPAKSRVCARNATALVGSGFATLQAGALAITMTGRAMLMLETTRANWFATAG